MVKVSTKVAVSTPRSAEFPTVPGVFRRFNIRIALHLAGHEKAGEVAPAKLPLPTVT